ncbi:MAG: tRNA-dihydrouridine synthase [Solirubrobacterales bacterium]|nr:tRNA-dihydrouridine synthase [Solirubrobacterales bacterium]
MPMIDLDEPRDQAALTARLNEPFEIGGVAIPNRVSLAPLAGIGNWFFRLQARRFGAGLLVSEMVSSHAVRYGNERTCTELLRIHPDEHPVAIQLFGEDPVSMEAAAAVVAETGADMIDLNMGCPVPKVCKTGAGAALLRDHDRAVDVAKAAVRGSGLPVTVKIRPGQKPGETDGVTLAKRLEQDAGVAGIGFHPRHASQQHKGRPDYDLARELVEALEIPVTISGGMRGADTIRSVFDYTGAEAVMLARGVMGNPWLFSQVRGLRDQPPSDEEIIAELEWTIDRAIEHIGEQRASRYLRKFYPWYIEQLGLGHQAQDAFQRAESIDAVREMLSELAVSAFA